MAAVGRHAHKTGAEDGRRLELRLSRFWQIEREFLQTPDSYLVIVSMPATSISQLST